MSSFGKNVNPCGRRLQYPKFQSQMVWGPTSQPPPDVKVGPAPDVESSDSVCKSYYDDQKVSSASDACKACWQNALDSDAACPCTYDPQNPCAFIRCVDTEFNKPVARCKNAYAALANLDDLDDADFKPPFDLKDVKDCPKSTAEGFFGWLGSGSNESGASWFLVFAMIAVVAYLIYHIMTRPMPTYSRYSPF